MQKKRISSDVLLKKFDLHNNIFSSIGKALKSKKAKACFIFVAADQHANLVSQSLKTTYILIALNQLQ